MTYEEQYPAYYSLPVEARRSCLNVAEVEESIAAGADYLLGSSIRHPACDLSVARRCVELAQYRRTLLDWYPSISAAAIDEVRPLARAKT